MSCNGALKRLLEDGWIERMDNEGEQSARQRKAYALTRSGRSVLEAEAARMKNLVTLMQQRAPEGNAI